MKAIKKLKDKYLSVAQLMGLIVMLSIASCQKNCKDKGTEGGGDASLALEIGEKVLEGSNRTINATIKPKGEVAASLSGLSLKAKITHQDGGTGSKLQYASEAPAAEICRLLNKFSETESKRDGELLNSGDSVTIPFKVQPGPGVSKVTVILEICDTDNIVATETVNWTLLPAGTGLVFEGLTHKVENGDMEIKFKVKKTGEGSLDLNKVGVKVTTTTKATVQDLKDNKISLSKESDELSNEVVLAIDPKTEKKATFSLELFYNGNVVPGTKRIVEWTAADLQLIFDDLTQEDSNKQIKFKVKNGGKSVSVADKLKLGVKNANKSNKAEIAYEGTNIGTSGEIDLSKLGNISKEKSSKEVTLTIDPKGEINATFELQLVYDGEPVATETVKWGVYLQLSNLHPEVDTNTGQEQAKFQVRNTGKLDLDLSSSKLELAFKNAAKSGKAELSTGTKSLGTAGKVDLSTGIATIQKDKESAVQTLCILPNGEQQGEFELELVYDGKPVATETVKWTAAKVELKFDNAATKPISSGSDGHFDVKNTGSNFAIANRLKLEFKNNDPKGDATIECKSIGFAAKTNGEIDLTTLGDIPSQKSVNGLDLTLNAGTIQKTGSFELKLLYNGVVVDTHTLQLQ